MRCLFRCMRYKDQIVTTLEKKEYIMTFLKELSKETDNKIDDLVLEFISRKLYD